MNTFRKISSSRISDVHINIAIALSNPKRNFFCLGSSIIEFTFATDILLSLILVSCVKQKIRRKAIINSMNIFRINTGRKC